MNRKKFLVVIEEGTGTRWNGQEGDLPFFIQRDVERTVKKISIGPIPAVTVQLADDAVFHSQVAEVLKAFLSGPDEEIGKAIESGRKLMKQLEANKQL